VGESELKAPTPNVLNSYPVQIPVQPGDVIGFFQSTTGECRRIPAAGYSYHAAFSDPATGTTSEFWGPFDQVQFDISAVLEPDADCDGFGDETQDASIDPNGCAPETQITKHPKDKVKTKRKRAKAVFEFTSNEPGSMFECSLDGRPFAACTSPHTVKVKTGKHTFAVRATDPAGNTDSTPATDSWKVKKKRKK